MRLLITLWFLCLFIFPSQGFSWEIYNAGGGGGGVEEGSDVGFGNITATSITTSDGMTSNGTLIVTSGLFDVGAHNRTLQLQANKSSNTATNVPTVQIGNNIFSSSSGPHTQLELRSRIIQSGTAGYNIVFANVSSESTGSGDKYLFRGAVNNVDVFNVDADGLIKGKRPYAMLSEDQESSYILSTTFRQITSIQTYKSSSDITAASNSITIGIDGDYPILTSFAVDGHAGHAITLAVFKNGTSITERTSRLGGGHEHPVSLANYSSATVSSGAITDLAADDAVYLIIDEAAGVPNAIYFEFNGSVQEPNEIRFRNFNYDGVSGHENKVYAFSHASSAYHAVTANVDDLPHAGGTDAYRFYDRTFKFPEPHADYALGGTARIKILHPDNGTGTHDWYFDKVTLLDNHASASITWPDNLSLVVGDILTFYIKSDEDSSHAFIHDGKISLGIPSN